MRVWSKYTYRTRRSRFRREDRWLDCFFGSPSGGQLLGEAFAILVFLGCRTNPIGFVVIQPAGINCFNWCAFWSALFLLALTCGSILLLLLWYHRGYFKTRPRSVICLVSVFSPSVLSSTYNTQFLLQDSKRMVGLGVEGYHDSRTLIGWIFAVP